VTAVFDTVLIANRGEIAVRIIRTLRRMGIRSVAVYSDADAGARHVREADAAVRIGPAPARESYLSVERVLYAAVATGAQAVHPGYGFLSENTAFAQACADAGVVFVGPPPYAVEVMGDKIRAKQTVSRAGVPVVPGRGEPGMTDADLVDAAAEVGFPVLVKPSAGGGGKGMRLVHEPAALAEALASARREAAPASATTRCSSSGSSPAPATSRCRCSRTRTATPCTWASGSAASSAGTRRSSRKRPRRCSDAAQRARYGDLAVATAQAVGTPAPGRSSSSCLVRRPTSRSSWR
jgi:acetyl-CoA/propionyl-CoA carboxylase biotin carboxyl carrier protein